MKQFFVNVLIFVQNHVDVVGNTILPVFAQAMFNTSTIEEARKLKNSIIDEYQDVAKEAMNILDSGFEDSIVIMNIPSKYRVALRTSNIIERENREIRRREKVIGIFPNVESIIRLIGAILYDDHNDWSSQQRLFDMTEYYDKQSSILAKLNKGAA